MICNFTHFSIALLWFLPAFSSAQTEPMDLSLEQSLTLLRSENKSLRIAGKEVELAKNEHQKLNAFWYPTISAAGAYVHMSNPIEVRQSLNQFTDPAKEYVHSILPNDQFISSLLDKIGQNTLTLPLISQNVTSIDANLTWPIFTGGKRIYAGKIGKKLVSVAEVNREQVSANQQALLIESYFGLRLGQRVVEVKTETYNSLKIHYDQALKLEQQGMINRAERLSPGKHGRGEARTRIRPERPRSRQSGTQELDQHRRRTGDPHDDFPFYQREYPLGQLFQGDDPF